MNVLASTTMAMMAIFSLPSMANAETLNSQQVKALMVGTTVSWVTPDGETRGYSRYRPNGTSAVTVTAPNEFKDKGTWRIMGNQFCSTWKVIRDGQEGCSTVRTTTKEGVYRMDTVFIRSQ